MSEFTPIMSQEDFDKAIQKRLAQKEREVSEQFKEYLSPTKQAQLKEEYEKRLEEAKEALKAAEEKAKSNSQTVADLTKRAEMAESSLLKNKIAYENKLPLELAGRLMGDTEEDLKKDAESLAALLKPSTAAPLKTNEVRHNPTTSAANDNGMLQLLSQLSDTLKD